MRPIHLAQLDEVRPVLVLTREFVRPHVGRQVGVLLAAQEQALAAAIQAAFDLGG